MPCGTHHRQLFMVLQSETCKNHTIVIFFTYWQPWPPNKGMYSSIHHGGRNAMVTGTYVCTCSCDTDTTTAFEVPQRPLKGRPTAGNTSRYMDALLSIRVHTGRRKGSRAEYGGEPSSRRCPMQCSGTRLFRLVLLYCAFWSTTHETCSIVQFTTMCHIVFILDPL